MLRESLQIDQIQVYSIYAIKYIHSAWSYRSMGAAIFVLKLALYHHVMFGGFLLV